MASSAFVFSEIFIYVHVVTPNFTCHLRVDGSSVCLLFFSLLVAFPALPSHGWDSEDRPKLSILLLLVFADFAAWLCPPSPYSAIFVGIWNNQSPAGVVVFFLSLRLFLEAYFPSLTPMTALVVPVARAWVVQKVC